MDALEGPDGETLYVDRSDGDIGTKGTFHVVYRDADPIHEARLAALDDDAFVRVLDPDDSLEDALAEALTDDQQVFVYGFADFLDDAIAAIEAAGGHPDAAKVENFG